MEKGKRRKGLTLRVKKEQKQQTGEKKDNKRGNDGGGIVTL